MLQANGRSFNGYRGRRVLVTGASGFIGRWVARVLSAAGCSLWLCGRDLNRLRALCEAYQIRGELCVVDLAKAGSFAKIYQEARPDVTFNLAGYGVDPKERDEAVATALNTRLVAEVGETVASGTRTDWSGLALVHVGSAAEYGPVPGPVTEDCPTNPVSLYGRTKLDGTRALESLTGRTRLRAVTARLFTVYGPGEGPGRLLPSLLAAAHSGENLALSSGEQRRDFTYVADVADGLLRLGWVQGTTPTVVNLATGTLTSVREFAECAVRVLGMRATQLEFGALPYRIHDVEQGPVDTTRLQQLLNWRPPTPIAEGITRTSMFEGQPSGLRV